MKAIAYEMVVFDSGPEHATYEEAERDWATREAWDGSTGHKPHCRAVPQNIRGIVQTGPCTCKH